MKVVLINHSDSLGGASVVTTRLMHALRARGVDARMLVTSATSGSGFVETAASPHRAKIPFLAEHLRIFSQNGFSRADLFKASIATDGLPLSEHPLVREADIVHLNWINQGMLSLSEIRRIGETKPIVWTMHDMWNLTGVCHHAADCDRYTTRCHDCHLLHFCAGSHDLSARTFDRKAALYSAHPVTFVAVSSWLAERARRSALTRDSRIETIPCAFPVSECAKTPVFSREQLGLPPDGRLIVFCAARIDDPVKDLDAAIDALNRVAVTHPRARAIIIGACKSPDALARLRMPYVAPGMITDTVRLRAIFAHADVILSSSRYESFGATLVEGQAAGATPVGLIHDGRADIITDGVTGYAATDRTDLARAIGRALDAPIPRAALTAAANRFSDTTVARRYIDLYNDILHG